jgi:hypothetical protein
MHARNQEAISFGVFLLCNTKTIVHRAPTTITLIITQSMHGIVARRKLFNSFSVIRMFMLAQEYLLINPRCPMMLFYNR